MVAKRLRKNWEKKFKSKKIWKKKLKIKLAGKKVLKKIFAERKTRKIKIWKKQTQYLAWKKIFGNKNLVARARKKTKENGNENWKEITLGSATPVIE